MKGRSPTFTEVPLDIVGSNKFGRYPKISVEQTFNMIISDNFLVPTAGYLAVKALLESGKGRGIFTSVKLNQMIVVVSNLVFTISTNLTVTQIGTINSFIGDVFIDENYNDQIAICDLQSIYIYNYSGMVSPAFAIVPALGFRPGYISYQDGRFIAAALGTATWRLSALGDGTSWPNDSQHVGTFQTKPDTVVATQRFPGRGNLLYVFGSTVVEPWTDIGATLFPYQKNQSVNIDYGCLNAATIAYNDTIIVWLAANEKSGPMIAYSTGGDIKKISTDGIDFKFTDLANPSNSYGFLFRQDGHLIYQLTFPDDNLTYIYDFNTDKFFTLTDENMDEHIAKRVAFFNDTYYFVSNSDGNLYELSTKYSTYNGKEIPRIRVCRNIRMPDASRFAINNLTFTIEEGTQKNIYATQPLLTEDLMPLLTESGQPILIDVPTFVETTLPLLTEAGDILLTESGEEILVGYGSNQILPVPQTVQLSVSKNGGESFGTIWSKNLNTRGNFKNRLIYWQLGSANDFVPQFRFVGLSRFVATDGLVSIYQ